MKIKVVKFLALVFLLFASINIVGSLFFGMYNFSNIYKHESSIERDTIIVYEKKIDKYCLQLDSLLIVNPFQAELFANKLHKKYKKIIFMEYNAFALFKQMKFKEALSVYKIIETPYSVYNGTKMNNNRNIAMCFENLKQFDSAIYYYKVSSINDNLNGIGRCFELCNKKDSSLFIIHYCLKRWSCKKII